MIWALLILGGLSILIALAAWLLMRADDAMLREAVAATKYTGGAVAGAMTLEPRTPETPKPPMVTVRFLNERGRTIGQLEIPAARRKPTLVLDKLGTRHICQASHQEADGTWIYRRSGRG